MTVPIEALEALGLFALAGWILAIYCAMRTRASGRYASDLKAQLVRETMRHMAEVDRIESSRRSLIEERDRLREQNNVFRRGQTPPPAAKAAPPAEKPRATGMKPSHSASYAASPTPAPAHEVHHQIHPGFRYDNSARAEPEPEQPCRASRYEPGGGGDFGGGGASSSWDSGSSSSDSISSCSSSSD